MRADANSMIGCVFDASTRTTSSTMNAPHLHESQRPLWLDHPLPDMPALEDGTVCDVCVVGGGMAGLLVAEQLVARGLSVVVLDKGRLAAGETGHTTAHFVTALDDRYTALERMHGDAGARLAARSHAAAIDHVEALVARLGAECDWKRIDGYLVVNDGHADEREELLAGEWTAARKAGLEVERVASVPAPWPATFGAALRFPRQAQVHPLLLLRAVTQRLVEAGVRIHTHTHVTEVHGGSHPSVETKDGPTVKCSHVVVATNSPFNNLLAVHTKQAGYQTYVAAFRVPAGFFPPLLLWDGLWKDDASYRYIRVLPGAASGRDGNDLLIVGGEDHKTGQGRDGDEPYERLEQWTRRHFPQCGAMERRWSGEVMEPADGLGYIGHNPLGPKNVYVVTGDSGNGMTHSGIAALLVPDLITGRENPWAGLYDPSRKIGLHALAAYARENVNAVAQYGDWFGRGDVTAEADIAAGEGAIVVSGMKRIAVFKDERGDCTRLVATCPHLGGVVRWNSHEKTWDCPCHASRFDRHGKVFHGPANTDLEPDREGAGGVVHDFPADVVQQTSAVAR